MPPGVRIQKKDIVSAAVDLVRERGEAALNARSLAARLNCSTQPIFSNFSSMEDVRSAVVEAAEELFQETLRRETLSGRYPPYKAGGMAYIRFASEERELFKLLYMRDRSAEAIPEETDLGNQMEEIVHRNTGLSGMDTKLFHLEMWIYVHGIATMIATDYLSLDWDLISRMLTDAYEGLKKRFEKETTAGEFNSD